MLVRAPVTRDEDLSAVPDGERIVVEGRYERFQDFPPPPGPPRTARIVLGQSRVLVGGYLEAESVRPTDELERLDGAVVRVTGRFRRTRAFPSPGPMPGIWTGGGPQLYEVDPPELVSPP